CGDLDEMPVWIAEVDALATQLPGTFLFHCYLVFRQPCFPVRERLGTNRKGEMQLAVAIVRRLHFTRGALLEQQQDLPATDFHGTAAFAEIANDPEAKDLLVELRGPGDVGHIQ